MIQDSEAISMRNESPNAYSSGHILILYDDGSTHVSTIYEHLAAFQKYSRYRVHFMPATLFMPLIDDGQAPLDLSPFSAVALHYSVRISVAHHLSKGIARALSLYHGPKLLFIQDEYENTELARTWIEQLGLDAVFTNIPMLSVPQVYSPARFKNTDFLPTLTGYVPEDPSLDSFALPLEERRIFIGYRGRRLPYQYGDLGQEKCSIGTEVKRLATEAGLPIDIEVDDSRRIYGANWYRFLGSCRATLGTESGANVFDFDGSLAKLAAEYSEIPYAEFRNRFLAGREGEVRMNQISPKIFEAIRLRTALVLFEGEYSGVVIPNKHYIPLKKDYSNINEVFLKLKDIGFLSDLTSRAYRDVIQSKKYSYEAFISSVDNYLDKRLYGHVLSRVISIPALTMDGKGTTLDNYPGNHSGSLMISDAILGPTLNRDLYLDAIQMMDPQRFQNEMIEAQGHIIELNEQIMALKSTYSQQIEILENASAQKIEALENASAEQKNRSQAQIDGMQELVRNLETQIATLQLALDAGNIVPSLTNIGRLVLRRIGRLLPKSIRISLAQRLHWPD